MSNSSKTVAVKSNHRSQPYTLGYTEKNQSRRQCSCLHTGQQDASLGMRSRGCVKNDAIRPGPQGMPLMTRVCPQHVGSMSYQQPRSVHHSRIHICSCYHHSAVVVSTESTCTSCWMRALAVCTQYNGLCPDILHVCTMTKKEQCMPRSPVGMDKLSISVDLGTTGKS